MVHTESYMIVLLVLEPPYNHKLLHDVDMNKTSSFTVYNNGTVVMNTCEVMQ